MFKPFFLFVGLRYAYEKRKNHFISFISLTSMLGIAIGVTVLITVISVMNGFSKEIRAKMLKVTPHMTLRNTEGLLSNWQPVLQKVMAEPGVVGAAPYIVSQGLLVQNGGVQPTVVRGIDPEMVDEVYPLRQSISSGKFEGLKPGSFGVVIGKEMARSLGLEVGDKITLLIPEATATITGVNPKYKRLTLVAIFDTGTHYDDRNAFIHIKDAAKLFRTRAAITGIQIKVRDELQAPAIAADLNSKFDHQYWITNWTDEYSSFFEALNMEKIVMWCILCLIIAVAAFNLVSSLVMMVTDKRSDIAIMRTMGATPRTIMGIFVAQGAIVGIIGTVLGLAAGLLLAYNITEIAEYIQQLFNVEFVSEDVYLISHVPSLINKADVVLICCFSLIMSLLATLYPAWRAANIAPAEGLRYE
jgi:lipoprotein-releasing system permease protein